MVGREARPADPHTKGLYLLKTKTHRIGYLARLLCPCSLKSSTKNNESSSPPRRSFPPINMEGASPVVLPLTSTNAQTHTYMDRFPISHLQLHQALTTLSTQSDLLTSSWNTLPFSLTSTSANFLKGLPASIRYLTRL